MASARRFGLGLGAAMIAALLVPVLAAAAPAAPAGGDQLGTYDPATAAWSLDGVSRFLYGNPGDQPFMGDWDCDGVDTPGLHRAEDTAAGPAGKVYLRNSQTTGIADVEYFFGNPGDQAFAGDFNGDGCDTVGLYRPSTGQVFLTNLLGARNRGIGAAQVTYDFPTQGRDLAGARALAADFDGDGIDTVALHLPATATVLGVRTAPVTFGNPGDQLVAGAWTGGAAALGAYRGSGFHLAGRDVTAAAAGGGVPLAWSASAASGPAPRLAGPCGTPTILGTTNADVINGTAGNDVIDGLGGNDVIGGKAGNDTICGGDGNDVLNGDQGNDTVYGDAGDDNVNGNDGNDRLHGGDGADIVTGDKDDDTLFGDAGADNMNGGSGNDFVDGGGGDDLLSGSGGDDTLLGRAGADVLNGGPGFDTCDVGPDGTAATKCENGRPQAQNQSVAATEDGPAVSAAFATVDPDGNPTTYSLATSPAEGSVTNNGDGTFTFDPKPDFQNLAAGKTRQVTFTYTATDSHGATSDVATVTITVTGVDDPPFAGDDAAGTDEDTAITIVVLANDGDVDAGETVSVVKPVNAPPFVPPPPAPAVPGGFSSAGGAKMFNNGDGTFSYDPSAAYQHLAAGRSATDSFEYVIASTGGGTAKATVTITVTGVNDAPEAHGQTVSAAGPVTVTMTGADPDIGDDLTFSVPAATAAGGTLANLVNGPGNSATVDYTPPVGTPPDQFTFTASDGKGGSAAAPVTINPGPVDDPGAPPPPDITGIVADVGQAEVIAGTPTEILLTAAAPATIGDLTFSVVAGPPSGEGSITTGPTPVPPNQPSDPVRAAAVTYDPGSFVGKTSFTFEACRATTCSATATVSIEVEDAAPPAPPVAGTLTGVLNPDSSVVIDLAVPGQPNPEDEGPPAGRSHGGTGPDVYFLVDVTGSMSSLLPGIEDDILAIMDAVEEVHPGAHFGLGTYDDIGTTLNPQASGPPFATLFDNLVPLGPKAGVAAEIGGAGAQLVNSFGGDLAEAQLFALDRLARTEQAGFDVGTPSVIVWYGDAPGHDPVCDAVSQVGDITEASVIAALRQEGGAGIAVIANSLPPVGLDAGPGPGGEYSDTSPPDCAVVGGSAGQASRITAATGGSLLHNGAAAAVSRAVLAAINGTPPDLTYSVLLPLDFAGMLKTSTGAIVPVGTAFSLTSPKLTYLSAGVAIGTSTKFSYTVTSTVTGLSATADVLLGVRLVGVCETDVTFCDDGRDGD